MFAIIFFFIAVNSRISVKHKQIKKVLGQREQFLENIFASIQEGLIITDPEFNIIRVNSVMEQWYEHAGPLVGRKCYAAFFGRNEPCNACPACVTLESGEAAQEIVPKMGPEGEVVGWLALFSSPLADAATGEVTGVIGFARDITAQVQAEEALRKERDFVANILDTISSLVVVLDPEGRIQGFNRACEQTTGYSLEEVKGKSVWDFLLLPEEVEEARRVFQELQTSKSSNDYENYWVTREGYQCLIAWSNMALRDGEDRVEYIIATGIDITARRQAEDKLRESEERYRSLVENINLGITLIGSDYRIIMTNAAQGRMFQKPASEFVGKECFREFEKREVVCSALSGFPGHGHGEAGRG